MIGFQNYLARMINDKAMCCVQKHVAGLKIKVTRCRELCAYGKVTQTLVLSIILTCIAEFPIFGTNDDHDKMMCLVQEQCR